MRVVRQTGIMLAVLAAALAATIPTPARAMHAAGPPDRGPAGPARTGIDVSLGADVGFVTGTASELVFAYPYGRKTKISELTWDLAGVAVAGVRGSVALGGGLRLNAGLWTAVSEGDGAMVDRDWLYEDPQYLQLDPGDGNWTDESRHPDTSVDSGLLLDLNVSFTLLQSRGFTLGGVVGYKRESWEWSSRGGTFVYSDEGFRDFSGDFADYFGEGVGVIDYEQVYAVPYAGLSAGWQAPTLRVEARALFSPFASATDTDRHLLLDKTYEGEFSGGTYLGLGLDASWAFAPRWFATIGLEYESVSEMTGDTVITVPEGRYLFESAGGVAFEAFTLTLGAGYRF